MSFRKSTNKKGTLSTASRSQKRQSSDKYGNALASAHLLGPYAPFRGSFAHYDAFTPDDSSLKHQDLSHDKNNIILDLFNSLDELIRRSVYKGQMSDYENRKYVFEYNAKEILDSLSQYVSCSEIEELRDFFQEHINELLDDVGDSRIFKLKYYDIKQRILNPLNKGIYE